MQCDTASDEYCYKALSPALTSGYVRFYVNFSSLPTSGNSVKIGGFVANSGSSAVAVVKNDAGTMKWGLQNAGGSFSFASTPNPTTGVWYCVEVRAAANDELRLYVNDASVINVAEGNRSYTHILVGALTKATALTNFIDCIAVADTYIGPEITLQTVTDALSLADNFLRNKTVATADSLGAQDSVKGNKSLLLSDSVNLSTITRALKTLNTVDELSLSDSASTPLRILHATDSITLVETVQAGAGGAKKTRLFLILGDLALGIDNI